MGRATAGTVRFEEWPDFDVSAASMCFESHADRAGDGPHTHLTLELLFVDGDAVVEWMGEPQLLARGQSAVYFGGYPHAVLEMGRDSVLHLISVSIVEALSWTGAATLLDAVLAGQFVRVDARSIGIGDAAVFERWAGELFSAPATRRPAKLEIEAAVRRILSDGAASWQRDDLRRFESATVAGVAKAVQYIAVHFAEPIAVDDVAAAVAWHRDHLMASFRAVCGIPLWQCVTRMRLAEAKRLLACTDLPVLTICFRAGFSSTVRMYDAFHRHCGMTPARYRRSVSGSRSRGLLRQPSVEGDDSIALAYAAAGAV